jgi:hypothetical protein
MPTGLWQAGYNKSIAFLGLVMKIKSTSWDEHIEKLIVTHTQSGGVQGWIAGILDGEGHVDANIDASLVPPNFALVAGIQGIAVWGIGSANAFQLPVGVTKVHYQSAVAGLVEYSFDIALNSETGVYVRPS